MPANDYVRATVSLAALFLFITIIGVINTNSHLDPDRNLITINRDGSDPAKTPPDFSGLMIWANMTLVEKNGFYMKIHFSFAPRGEYLDKMDPLQKTPSKTLFLTLDNDILEYKQQKMIPVLDQTYPIMSGNPILYPYDDYATEFFISVSTDKANVPVSFSLMNSLADWSMTAGVTDVSSGSFTMIHGRIIMRRSGNQRFFSVFIVLIMWTLSLSVFWLAVTLCWRDRKVEGPTIAVCTTMLFALPAVRNVQPGSPPIGCTADVVGFFWNIGFVAAASLILVWNYIIKYQADPKPIEMIPLRNIPVDLQEPQNYGAVNESDKLL